MEPSELLRHATQSLDRLGIEYRVVGSMASILYGEPRFTIDIDIAVRLTAVDVPAFLELFPSPEYDCSEAAVRQAVDQMFQFNVLQPTSGLKIDFMVVGDSAFDQSRFSRGARRLIDDEHEAWFASPEDVILKKLVYFQEGGSEKHLRDIVGILKVQQDRIDYDYLHRWVGRLTVESSWSLVEARRQESEGDAS